MSSQSNPTHRVPWRTVIAYGAPAIGAGYMYLMLSLFVMKFSTDVLLISPLIMGMIFSASRIWDAVSDPMAGYFSDRTTLRFGRRRTWMLASVIPVSIAFYMVFAPPAQLSGGSLVAWMAVAVIGFYSAMTLFFVPHLSLGAELSDDYHQRSRLFGARHAFYTMGAILSLVSMQFLINAEQTSTSLVREVAAEHALFAVIVMALLTIFAVARLRERAEFQSQRPGSAGATIKDVWANTHARLLLIVTFIEHLGSAAIGALTLYIAQYVVGTPSLAPFIILCYMVPSSASVPLWLPLSRRFGKVRLWMFSMLLTGVSFGGMFMLPFLPDESSKLVAILILAAFAGLAAGCGGTIGPSVQGDVIDYDELQTGQRKEGAYFAAWNFVYKGATGMMLLLTGFVLQISGFVPNQPQSMQVQVAMVALYGLFPLVCYIAGAWMFRRFTLDEQAHADIREQLKLRRTQEAA